MINLEKIKQEKCRPSLLRRPAPAPYFHPLFLIFQIPPSGEGNQNSLPSPLKKGVRTMITYCILFLTVKFVIALISINKHFFVSYYKQFGNPPNRSSHQRCSVKKVFCEKDVLKNFTKLTAKQSVSLHRCFHVKFAKEHLFLYNTFGGRFWPHHFA